jgi:hypothetical protein
LLLLALALNMPRADQPAPVSQSAAAPSTQQKVEVEESFARIRTGRRESWTIFMQGQGVKEMLLAEFKRGSEYRVRAGLQQRTTIVQFSPQRSLHEFVVMVSDSRLKRMRGTYG